MSKSPDAFRTISEVAEWLGIQAHVLRFWESKFTQIKPVKRAGGRRYYRPADVDLLGSIKVLLHEKGLSIKDVQALLREHGPAHVAAMGGEQSVEDGAGDTATDTVGPATGEIIDAEASPFEAEETATAEEVAAPDALGSQAPRSDPPATAPDVHVGATPAQPAAPTVAPPGTAAAPPVAPPIAATAAADQGVIAPGHPAVSPITDGSQTPVSPSTAAAPATMPTVDGAEDEIVTAAASQGDQPAITPDPTMSASTASAGASAPTGSAPAAAAHPAAPGVPAEPMPASPVPASPVPAAPVSAAPATTGLPTDAPVAPAQIPDNAAPLSPAAMPNAAGDSAASGEVFSPVAPAPAVPVAADVTPPEAAPTETTSLDPIDAAVADTGSLHPPAMMPSETAIPTPAQTSDVAMPPVGEAGQADFADLPPAAAPLSEPQPLADAAPSGAPLDPLDLPASPSAENQPKANPQPDFAQDTTKAAAHPVEATAPETVPATETITETATPDHAATNADMVADTPEQADLWTDVPEARTETASDGLGEQDADAAVAPVVPVDSGPELVDSAAPAELPQEITTEPAIENTAPQDSPWSDSTDAPARALSRDETALPAEDATGSAAESAPELPATDPAALPDVEPALGDDATPQPETIPDVPVFDQDDSPVPVAEVLDADPALPDVAAASTEPSETISETPVELLAEGMPEQPEAATEDVRADDIIADQAIADQPPLDEPLSEFIAAAPADTLPDDNEAPTPDAEPISFVDAAVDPVAPVELSGEPPLEPQVLASATDPVAPTLNMAPTLDTAEISAPIEKADHDTLARPEGVAADDLAPDLPADLPDLAEPSPVDVASPVAPELDPLDTPLDESFVSDAVLNATAVDNALLDAPLQDDMPLHAPELASLDQETAAPDGTEAEDLAVPEAFADNTEPHDSLENLEPVTAPEAPAMVEPAQTDIELAPAEPEMAEAPAPLPVPLVIDAPDTPAEPVQHSARVLAQLAAVSILPADHMAQARACAEALRAHRGTT
ncbi:MerR family transcriptional regulator [Phaeobacter porticola]|uniref:Putative transcriptional regulator n=1 Tax=Phaeobacter porticola TaxID=1844006 RepID=A0A1L3I360_9RHOB|nr:MerR family transcriptional regulator [Phaeobacter porticola]APG46543.1 putative transcriptional regulator [Phaeobacter porticola]